MNATATKTETPNGTPLVDGLRSLRRQRFERLRMIANGGATVTPEELDALLVSTGTTFETFEAWAVAGSVPQTALPADDVRLCEQLHKRRIEIRVMLDQFINEVPYGERELEGLDQRLRSLKGEKGFGTREHRTGQGAKEENRVGIEVMEDQIKNRTVAIDKLRTRRAELMGERDEIDKQLAELQPT